MIMKVWKGRSKQTEVSGSVGKPLAIMWLALAVASSASFGLVHMEPETANNQTGKGLFQTKCATCHGPDGAGSKLGRRINVPDLRSSKVQGQSDTVLKQIISDGQKNMPAFRSTLNKVEIDSLIHHIRGFGIAK
jgi:mono/diheme cytochrome c family protein